MPTISETRNLALAEIKPNARNARTHSKRQTAQIAASIKEFGFTSPVLVDENNVLIAGHGRLAAAITLDLRSVPAITISGLTDLQKRRLMLSDNKIASNAGWDRELLSIEVHEIIIDNPDAIITGFEAAEIDELLSAFEANSADPADEYPILPDVAVSQRGDLWILGSHRLLCGDAREPGDLEMLFCATEKAAMAFLDPPYNVKVDDIVGRGKVKHEEFAMASGEMDPGEFREFLRLTLANAATNSKAGAVHFVCMDWRHFADLIEVGNEVYEQTLNAIAWVKSNAGQGSFYRSQHELIGVFKVAGDTYLNNIELGRHGRNRSNVWHYAGVNSFGKGRLDDLRSHPTVKPVAMVVDAIKDCTKRNDIVLDTFLGAGTTILACERVGRHARAIEFEPRYVDVAIRRWQAFTGKDAINSATTKTFDEVALKHPL